MSRPNRGEVGSKMFLTSSSMLEAAIVFTSVLSPFTIPRFCQWYRELQFSEQNFFAANNNSAMNGSWMSLSTNILKKERYGGVDDAKLVHEKSLLCGDVL